jgi:WD40 repeat protein
MCLKTFENYGIIITSVAFSYDGTLIVSGSSDKMVKIWNTASDTHLKKFEGHNDTVSQWPFHMIIFR